MNNRCSTNHFYGTVDSADGPVSLYIHIPFCVRKCRYCDFLSGPVDETVRRQTLQVMAQEIRSMAQWLRALYDRPVGVDTIYFGGGTPSLLSGRELDHLMSVLSSEFVIDDDAEITLECNPGTAGGEKLRAYRKMGVNRLSVGVQSFDDEELRMLGRIHTARQARQCVHDARDAGFDNLSLDLISALPGQSRRRWMDSLSEAVLLRPEHISAYSLILEEGTPLRDAYVRQYGTDQAPEQGGGVPQAEGSGPAGPAGENGSSALCGEGPEELLPPLPDEETDRRMYHETKAFLETHGYHRYEISNYARAGFESRHNRGYWTGHPYLGVGPGAASCLILPGDAGRIRWSNPAEPECYLDRKDPHRGELPQGAQLLSRRDQMAEFMILGLRLTEGISEQEFAREFGLRPEEVYGPVIRRYCGMGLLERRGDRLFLTEHGTDVSNTVMADFLP